MTAGEQAPGGEQPGEGSPPEGESIGAEFPEEAWEGAGRPLFLHPQWTVGLVLIFAVVSLLLGLFGHPLWLLVGSPFILVLILWIWARIVTRRRAP